jgi:hypothetical protein
MSLVVYETSHVTVCLPRRKMLAKDTLAYLAEIFYSCKGKMVR